MASSVVDSEEEVLQLEGQIATLMKKIESMEREVDDPASRRLTFGSLNANASPSNGRALPSPTPQSANLTPYISSVQSIPLGPQGMPSMGPLTQGSNLSSGDLMNAPHSPMAQSLAVGVGGGMGGPGYRDHIQMLRKTQRNDAYAAHVHHLWGLEHSTGLIPGSSEEWEESYKKLEKLTGSAELWLDFFTKKEEGGGDFAWGDFVVVKTLEREQDKRSMEAMYDLTPDRMTQLFNRHDNDGDGYLQFHEFSSILKAQGFPKLDPHFRTIFKLVKVNANVTKGLTLPEFATALKCLKLGQLIHETEGRGMRKGFSAVNFNVDEVQNEVVTETEDLNNFWFGHRKEGRKRWIHVDHPTEEILLHLTVKYHLHPLGVRDALDVVINPTEPVPIRCDRFGRHFYISLTYYYLVSTHPRVEFKTASVAIFMAGEPKWDTMISICHKAQQPRRPDPNGRSMDVWRLLQQTISSSHCRVREQKSDFLLYEVLAVCCQELRPIIQAERERLHRFHTLLLEKKCAFPSEYLQELSSIVMELSDLHRNLRPLRHLVQQLSRDPAISKYAKMYFADLDEEVEQVLDDLQLMKENCKSISDDYHRFQEIRLNDALGVLTVASAVFMPAQFVSGVYGMNFENMPELTWKYSYAVFWAFLILYFCISGMVAWKHFGHIFAQKDAAAGKGLGGDKPGNEAEGDDVHSFRRMSRRRKSCLSSSFSSPRSSRTSTTSSTGSATSP